MASVFLTNAPYTLQERYGNLASVGATLPCLGLLMLGAVLRKAGHRVCIVDAMARGMTQEEILKRIIAISPDAIGLTAVTPSIRKTAKLAKQIKSVLPNIPIILGGPHVTAVPEETLHACDAFDYGVVGEGEQTISELIESLAAGKSTRDIRGVVSQKDESSFMLRPRSHTTELDSLPFPAWDLLEDFPDGYRPAIFKYKRLPSTHIVSARGCPGRCIFCDTSVFGRRIRFHSPEYVLEMIRYLQKNFGIREIIFEDDQLLLKKERVVNICEGLIRANRPVWWSCSGRVNALVDTGLLRLMKRSGCWQINYGIESGNQAILDFAQKGITLEEVEEAVSLTHGAGISTKGYFILGLPYETEETMRNTIRFAKKLPLDDVSVFMLTPFPGSRMYSIADDHGTLEQGFDRMNILNVVYTPKGLPREMLLLYQRRFMKEFYLRPRILGTYLKRLGNSPSNAIDMAKAALGFSRHVFN